MVNQELLAIALAGVCTGLVILFTIPSFSRLARSSAGSKKSNRAIHLRDVYEDKDGAATEDSEEEYSDVLQKRFFTVTAIAGFAASISSGVFSTIWSSGLFPQKVLAIVDWLNVSIWALLMVQAISLSKENSPIVRFRNGLEAAASSLLLLIVLLVQNGFIANRIETTGAIEKAEVLSTLHLGLGATQFVLGLVALLASVSLPRRPAVFLPDGRAVDNQYTCSAFGRYTFSWLQPLLELSSRKTLELTDLPRPSWETRSRNILQAFNPKHRKGSLLKLLFFAHWSALLRLALFTIGQSVFRFSPQLAMLHLLRILEARGTGDGSTFEAWLWVFGLGGGLAIQASLDAWMMSELLLPIRAELIALIFEKAMRRKDVKEGEKPDTKAEPSSANKSDASGIATNTSAKSASGKGADSMPSLQNVFENPKKAKQSIINLIAVDTSRISQFTTMLRFFPDSLIMFGVSMTFMLTLIGWLPLACGLLSFVVLFPINYLISARFRKMQKRLMEARDTKTAVITEALQGMRQIKFSALEAQWEARIGEVRAKELSVQWQLYLAKTMLVFGWFLGPVALSSVSISVYAYLNGSLTPSTAFTTLGVFKAAQMAFTALPQVTTMAIESMVSLKRIQTYLDGPEQIEQLSHGEEISFQNASLAWPSDEKRADGDQMHFVLRDVNLTFPMGELSIISGKTGYGKSLLLSSILGESDLINDGVVTIPRPVSIDERFDSKATVDNWILPSSVAYVAQIPWIENATFKDNVIFNLPFDPIRYEKTLEACALTKDLEMLTDGDMTEIGANGINLSGGQRWRITLARALYSRAGILVLDDIFSAVDAHVGRWILDNALTGELGRGRTRILATHHVALVLPKAVYAVQLGDGTVIQAGTVDELRNSGAIDEILQDEGVEPEPAEETIDEPAELEAVKVKSGPADKPSTSTPKKFVEDEKRAHGKIKTGVYIKYFSVSGGLFWWGIGLLVFVATVGTQLMRSWWVKIWTDSYREKSTIHMFETSRIGYQTLFIPSQNSTESAMTENSNLGYYLKIYFALGLIECILGASRELYVYSLGWRGSRTLFKNMLFAVLRTPLRWIDTVPLGRILNRFTADFSTIDSNIATDFGNTIGCMMGIVAVIVAAFFASPIIIVFGVVLVAIAVYFAKFYLAGAREAKRLEATTRSPIYEQVGSALVGVGTIRAFNNTALYIQRIYDRIDNNLTTSWNLFLCNRWLSFRLGIIGAGFTFSVALLIVGIKTIDAALAGFAISFSLDFSKNITWALRFYTSCELDMNAVERAIEYCDLKTEPLDGLDAPAAWPTAGRLEVRDLEVGYAEDLPPVLKGLSFTVEAGQRVGIVGRTGAGKSSLAMALFRFLEARSGSILIDGIDVSKLKLFDLRSRLAIIPQDPTIFSGTIRSNLDAFNQCTDAELKEALQRVHLVSTPSSRDESTITSSTSATATEPTTNTNTNPFNSLSSPISSGGLNLSQGQRQLLCLARAILSRSKIMILDEATSAVDMDTDVLIQRSIREEFEGSTLLVIAHRLSTVADFDRILVMSEGRAVEFGIPKELLEKKGVFWDMVKESGDKGVLEGLILGEGAGNGSGSGSVN